MPIPTSRLLYSSAVTSWNVTYSMIASYIIAWSLAISYDTHAHTHIRLTALCLGLPRWAGTRKVKPIWILLKQEIVSGSTISWAICKCAHRSRQITTPAPHHSVFYRPDALLAAQPTVSKHCIISYNTHTHPFNGPLSGTTQVSRYQKGKTNLDFTEARDSEWQWHQQVCTSLQTDNHASTPPLSFFTGRMPFLQPNQQRQSTEG